MKTTSIILSFVLLIGGVFTSCQEELVDASKYEIKYDFTRVPTTSTGSAIKVSAAYAILSGTAASSDSILDCGIMVADNEDFNNPKVVSAEMDGGDFQVKVDKLEYTTVYFFRSYAVNQVAGGVYGETQTFTTNEGLVPFEISTEDSTVEAWSNAGFTTIDKDGDGNEWSFEFANEDSTQAYYTSYSWNESAFTPENYLLLPAISYTGVDGAFSVDLVALDPDWYEETFKIIISENPITVDNCQDAEVLFSSTLPDGKPYNMTVDIPASYEGKTIYLGIAHYDCSGNSAIILTGCKFSFAK
jgi:hypothetical protein